MPLPSPETISLEEFNALLERYTLVLNAKSEERSGKSAQTSLAALDAFRYVEAPNTFGISPQKRECTAADVKTLVEWKLRHGKFRPKLLSLVTSNSEDTVAKTVKNGVKELREKHDVSSASKVLCCLKGIGPATASLLLSVHDPDGIIFFSDEAFRWLCRGGNEKAPIKYNPKEYEELRGQAAKLKKRLNVEMLDIERAAYAVMYGDVGGAMSGDFVGEGMTAIRSGVLKKGGDVSKPKQGPSVKRKAETKTREPNVEEPRRSKRNKG